MRNLKGMSRHGVAACVLGVMTLWCIYIVMIAPKREKVHVLEQKMARMERTMQEAADAEPPLMQANQDTTSCEWDKKSLTWQITGDFAFVYDCVLKENGRYAVESFHLQKHTLGVRVVLSMDELPA